MRKIVLSIFGACILTASIYAFNTPNNNNDDKKCVIKIIKNINGTETVIDSVFNCNDSVLWNSFMDEHQIKIMCDSAGGLNSFVFSSEEDTSVEKLLKELNIEIEDTGKQIKVMKFISENGEEETIENREVEWVVEDKNTTVNIDDKGTKKEVKIVEKKGKNGNVTIKKWINGEEVVFTDEDMDESKIMMFIPENGEETQVIKIGEDNIKMDIDVEVFEEEGKHHVVIVKSITSKKEVEKLNTKVATRVGGSELSVDKLKFSPNPSNGKFELSFKAKKPEPITISVFDIQGKLIYNEVKTDFNGKYKNNIDISKNEPGTYVLQIVQGEKAKTSKIIIK